MTADTFGETGFSEHFLSTRDGLRIYYRVYGAERRSPVTVLCLPGFSRNCRDFHDLARHLSARHRVLCPDYRGVGRSAYASDWRAYSPQACLDDIRQLLAATNRHRVAVIGTSFGGILAAALAVAIPGAIAAAVLNDTGPETPPDALALVTEHIGRLHRFPDWPEAIAYLKSSFPGLPAGSEDRWRRIADHTFREQDGALVNNWDPAIAKPLPRVLKETRDLWPLFRALGRVPVLAIRGERSEILTADVFERMGRDLHGLQRLTVPGVGHAPDLAAPDMLTRIERFLENL